MLLLELRTLLVVCGDAEAAGRTKGVTRLASKLLQLALGPAPERSRVLTADRVHHDRIRGRPATQREPPVPAARAAGDFARLVQADA